ncbi:P68 family surface lipoprotein [Mycoplasma sp. 4079]|uniref:P68 family surface lipoprotein n=1 Tax=Mycoplasma sp. 4079 TaxID=3398615 RepID=UPI0039FC8135
MTKFKKLLINGAALLALTAPVISISCGNEGKPSNPSKPNNPGDPKNPTEPGDDVVFTRSELNGSVINGSTLGTRIQNMYRPNSDSDARPYDTTSNKVIIGHTFSDGGVQQKALQALVNKFNEAVYPTLEGAQKVELKRLGSGYTAGKDNITTGLNNTQTTDFVNIILNYTAIASELASKKMILSFNSRSKENSTDLSQFSEKFILSNFQTQNIDNPSTWVIPAFKSTTIFSINAPVLSYILDTLKENGMEIAEDYTDEYNEIKSKGQGDREGVKKIWGEPVSNVQELVNQYKGSGDNAKKISKAIFNSYAELLDFAKFTQKLFVNSSNDKARVHVFGVDDYTALYNQALYSAIVKKEVDAAKLAGTQVTQAEILKNASEFMIESVSTQDGKILVSYDVINNPASVAYAKTQEIYNKTLDALKSGGLKIFPGGQYSSNEQVKHGFAFSIGSTAGYTHNFIKSKSVANLENSEFSGATIEINKSGSLSVSSNSSVPGVHMLTKLDDGSFGYGKYKNKLVKNDADLGSKYELKFKSADEQTAFLNALSDDAAASKMLFVLINKTGNTKLFEKAKEQNIVIAEFVNQSNSEYYGFLIPNGLTEAKLVNAEDETVKAELAKIGYVIQSLSATELLGEDELVSRPTPLKWLPEDPYNVVYLQGPSMIGIHSNTEGDRATRTFVHWLMTSTQTYDKYEVVTQKGKETIPNSEGLTPRDMFQVAMGYILPYKGFEENEAFKSKVNPYLQTAYDLFAKVAKSQDTDAEPYVTFEEPGSKLADSFRSSVQAAWDSLQSEVNSNKADSNNQISSFEAFAKLMKPKTNNN